METLMDARQFWPGMTRDIEMMYVNCEVYGLLTQTLEPQVATAVTHSFEKFSINLGKQTGKNYLIS